MSTASSVRHSTEELEVNSTAALLTTLLLDINKNAPMAKADLPNRQAPVNQADGLWLCDELRKAISDFSKQEVVADQLGIAAAQFNRFLHGVGRQPLTILGQIDRDVLIAWCHAVLKRLGEREDPIEAIRREIHIVMQRLLFVASRVNGLIR